MLVKLLDWIIGKFTYYGYIYVAIWFVFVKSGANMCILYIFVVYNLIMVPMYMRQLFLMRLPFLFRIMPSIVPIVSIIYFPYLLERAAELAAYNSDDTTVN